MTTGPALRQGPPSSVPAQELLPGGPAACNCRATTRPPAWWTPATGSRKADPKVRAPVDPEHQLSPLRRPQVSLPLPGRLAALLRRWLPPPAASVGLSRLPASASLSLSACSGGRPSGPGHVGSGVGLQAPRLLGREENLFLLSGVLLCGGAGGGSETTQGRSLPRSGNYSDLASFTPWWGIGESQAEICGCQVVHDEACWGLTPVWGLTHCEETMFAPLGSFKSRCTAQRVPDCWIWGLES